MKYVVTIYLCNGDVLVFHSTSTVEILSGDEIRFDYLVDGRTHHAKFFIPQLCGYTMTKQRYTGEYTEEYAKDETTFAKWVNHQINKPKK